MTKAKPQKKTANKKSTKIAKKAVKKTATSKAVSTVSSNTPAVGRKVFDGKDEEVVCTKLKAAFMAGASKLQASILAGISHTALDRYFEKHPDFRAICMELSEVPLILAHNVQNAVLVEREKKDDVYDTEGNKIEYVPTSRAISASRYALRARDARYAAKNINFDIPVSPQHGGLTAEREAEIAEALKSWDTPEPEAYIVE